MIQSSIFFVCSHRFFFNLWLWDCRNLMINTGALYFFWLWLWEIFSCLTERTGFSMTLIRLYCNVKLASHIENHLPKSDFLEKRKSTQARIDPTPLEEDFNFIFQNKSWKTALCYCILIFAVCADNFHCSVLHHKNEGVFYCPSLITDKARYDKRLILWRKECKTRCQIL